jgi:periplasmic protein TonB
MSPQLPGWIKELLGKEPPTQASLFHYIKTEPEPSVWSTLDFSVLRHPIEFIKFIKEEWKAPRTRPSLFHYIEEEELVGQEFTWKEFFRDLFFGSPPPSFIPGVLSDPYGIAADPKEVRAARRRSIIISSLIHVVLITLAIVIVHKRTEPLPPKDNIVFVAPPIFFPFEGDGREGGGGGGGGKGEKKPPPEGRIPETSPVQLRPPDPDQPQPLMPSEEELAATVQMPIEIPQDVTLPVGDIQAPPSELRASGSGSGGGIGTGKGTGIGSGEGPGVGPGRGGGMGGGSGGGIGAGTGPYVVGGGVRSPIPLLQPLPPYTEAARKARVEGLVLLQAVVRKDGTVDSFRVLRGLGYGLDESAINTIATKWRFKPGTLNGTPVDVQANIEISFRLY